MTRRRLRGVPLVELLIIAAGVFVALWSGVRIWAAQPPAPRLCPEPLCPPCQEVP